VVGSLEKARKIGWGKDRDIDTFEDGYVPVFEKLKQLKVSSSLSALKYIAPFLILTRRWTIVSYPDYT
jgi:hypothetical protein